MEITLQKPEGIKNGEQSFADAQQLKFKSSFSFASSSSSKPFFLINNNPKIRNFSTKAKSSLQPSDVHHRLAETARISLSPNEVEEFVPKIRQVIDWFGQLQAVKLDRVKPAISAGFIYRH